MQDWIYLVYYYNEEGERKGKRVAAFTEEHAKQVVIDKVAVFGEKVASFESIEREVPNKRLW